MTEPDFATLREQVKQDILDAYGVTFEEIEALDVLLGGPAQRERRRRLERYAAALPGRMAEVAEEINERLAGVLPEGMRFEWGTPVEPRLPGQTTHYLTEDTLSALPGHWAIRRSALPSAVHRLPPPQAVPDPRRPCQSPRCKSDRVDRVQPR